MKLGYARVSTDDQDMLMQIEALKAAGVNEENIYKEHVSGMKKERPELRKILDYVREGDEIVVFKLDRISRSLKHLEELVEEFQKRGIGFISLHEKIDTTSAMGKFFFRMMGAIAELERDIISERTKEQLAAKKKNGIKLGRPAIDNEKLEMAFALYETKRYSVSEITKKTGISRTTFYDYLKNRREFKDHFI
jgi:DNA invertase Pin-like site-specific DNA recombinase